MNLTIPSVGVTVGPVYANQINATLSIIDQHDHSAANGVPITPNGLNINADLPFSENNITGLRSARFLSQSSPLSLPTDLSCLYVSGVDVWYNDGNGNQIQITANGGIAGTPGSISNLVAPASAAYVSGSQTFVWQSAANTSANMDFGSAIFRNVVSGSFGLTVSPPTLTGDYTITLPFLPTEQNIMTLDNSGNISAPDYDHTTINITPSLIKVIPNGLVNNINTEVSGGFLAVRNGYVPIEFAALGKFGDVITAYPETAVGGREILPYNYQIVNVLVSLRVASTTAATTFDILQNGVSIFSTLPSFAIGTPGNTDANSLFPVTAGITKPVLSTTNLSAADIMTMSITSAGAFSADGQVTLIVTQR